MACIIPQQGSLIPLNALIMVIMFCFYFCFNHQSICAQPELAPPLASLRDQISRQYFILVILNGLS